MDFKCDELILGKKMPIQGRLHGRERGMKSKQKKLLPAPTKEALVISLKLAGKSEKYFKAQSGH